MSYFGNGDIYIIVTTALVTEEMLNNMRVSFSVQGDKFSNSLRKNNDETKSLFVLKEPINTAFSGYRWYNHEDIQVELQKAEWVPSV